MVKLPDLQAWSNVFEKMIRIDSRYPDEIDEVIRWCQKDLFWQNNILSAEKLRKQYDQLVMKKNQPKVKYACR